ncbi:peptide chain release factor 1 [Microtetraspora sp. AC03309]|uniref:baeRF2 domain-containing protein n=1 Tax=Microtetraspora sp. AC03309 TaxID=2779376 RepID=UPI001E4F369F|nr:Vms1/Ankzf1 family peptidyl-tRNA hydrolase [Microtetraspora sp. AC03309]MCC5577874.1 peptide chain release factor 1 [Microtetraspora sp. AC03309]
MRLDSLRHLYERPGPFASVYLETARTTEEVANALELRWRRIDEELARAGAPAELRGAVGELVADPLEAAPGRAVFAEGSSVALTEPLAAPPRREIARWSPLPHVVPMLAQRGEAVPHLQVLADHAGADVIVSCGGPKRELSVEAADWPIQKTGQGGRSQTRYERDAEETWRLNAVATAEVIDKESHGIGAEVIVLAGEPQTRHMIMEALGKDTAGRVVVAERGSRAPGSASEPFQAEVDRALAAWVRKGGAALLAAYQAGPYATGLAETARALREGRVRTLLLRDDPSADATLWIGPEGNQLAADPGELSDLGVELPMEERADAALARAVAVTGAELWFVPELDSPDGVGAVLRF